MAVREVLEGWLVPVAGFGPLSAREVQESRKGRKRGVG
jgi:hypothetical protein